MAALAAPALHAQQENETVLPEITVRGQSTTNDYNNDISTVGGKIPTPIRDIPQTVNVINREVINAQGAASLQDALRYVPGVTIGSAEGGQIGNNINLRGFSAQTDIFLNGFRDRGQYYRDTFALESVEVLKGPSSMMFGRGSTGGVINQVSKVPSLVPHYEFSARVGTSDYYRGTVDVNHPLSDTSAFRMAMMGQSIHTTRNVMSNKDYGFAPSLRFGIGTPTEITLLALVQHNQDMADYGLPPVNGQPADVSYNTFYGLTDDRTVQDVFEIIGQIKHEFNSHITLQSQIQYSHYNTDVRETGPNQVGTLAGGIFTPLSTAIIGNQTNLPLSQLYAQLGSHDRNIRDTSLYNHTDLITKFKTGPIKHTLITGVVFGRDTYRNQAYSRSNLPALSLIDPAHESTPSNSVSTKGNLADSSADTLAAYANDRLNLGKHWQVVGGVRWDLFDASLTNTVPSSFAPPSASQAVHFTSVRGGVIYQPSDEQSYYASYGTSFNPSLQNLTTIAGQQNLAPEKNRAYEVGAKWDLFDDNLSLTSALFRIEKTNARTQVSSGIYALNGDVRVDGFEFGAVGRITSGWQILGGYTYLNGKITKAAAFDNTQGKLLANTPHHNATLWTTYNPTSAWEVGGGLTYMSKRYANNTNVVSAPGFVRFDATLAYHQPKYEVRLNMLNVTDEQYIQSVIQSDGGRSVPGIGRTTLATFTYKF
jgi:catecholate siderophore receptor